MSGSKTPIYAIVRIDGFHRAEAPPEVKLSGTKAYRSREAAERECSRLQSLRTEGDIIYVVLMVRLEE